MCGTQHTIPVLRQYERRVAKCVGTSAGSGSLLRQLECLHRYGNIRDRESGRLKGRQLQNRRDTRYIEN